MIAGHWRAMREVQLRKKNVRKSNKGQDEDGDGTEILLPLLRRDIASIKIQAQARRRRATKRVAKVRPSMKSGCHFWPEKRQRKTRKGQRSAARPRVRSDRPDACDGLTSGLNWVLY